MQTPIALNSEYGVVAMTDRRGLLRLLLGFCLVFGGLSL